MKAKKALIVFTAATLSVTAHAAIELSQLKAPQWTVPELGLRLVRIPPGAFLMGSPQEEAGRRHDEAQHEVTLTQPFYMGIYEVTQEQYYKIMLPHFDHDNWQYARGPLHAGCALFYRERKNRNDYLGGKLTLAQPMECVSWYKAVEFCRRLTAAEQKAGRLPESYVYRLPTEAEWEYACRAGTTGPYNIVPQENDPDYLRSAEYLASFANVAGGKGDPVGRRKPNAWGLYDMHGNVYEWCCDWYGPYPQRKAVDPGGPPRGTRKVARGGCFAGAPPFSPPGQIARGDCYAAAAPFIRSASRYCFDPHASFYAIVGFRIVLAKKR